MCVNTGGETLMRAIRTDAAGLYSGAAETHNVWMGAADDAIRLFHGEVIQNDSPMMGRSTNDVEPFEALLGGVVLRKQLEVADPRADEVWLAFVARERIGHSATLRIGVNGVETLRPPSPVATPTAGQYWGLGKQGEWNWSRWYYVQLPAGCLVAGANTIELSAIEGAEGWQIMYGLEADFHIGAREHEIAAPHASARSMDGGSTFSGDQIGAEGRGPGEYIIRLDMRKYRREGHIVSDVIDAGGQAADAVKQPVAIQGIRLAADADLPEGTGIAFDLSWAPSPFTASDDWTAWEPAADGLNPPPAGCRYAQWRATLSTEDTAVTPALRSVTVECEHDEPGPVAVEVVQFDCPRQLRASVAFVHEQYDHPRLQELRAACGLDSVIADAEDDWETIRSLMRWAYQLPLPNCSITPWDSLDWLGIERNSAGEIVVNTYEQRRRDKMCLYPNVLLTQLLLACGIPARHVNINSEGMTGHEVCEAWCNTWGKWIHLDATRDFYWADRQTGEPLSILEVHNELARHLDKPETWEDPHVLRLGATTSDDTGIEIADSGEWPEVGPSRHTLYQTTAHFRIVPRSDYCARPYPLPVSQGVEVWGWDGYINWADDTVPPMRHFTTHTNRVADMYPTCNQTYMLLECVEHSTVRVRLDHDMPGFAHFEARIGVDDWAPVDSPFDVRVDEPTGIAVRAVNSMGMVGPQSRAALRRIR